MYIYTYTLLIIQYVLLRKIKNKNFSSYSSFVFTLYTLISLNLQTIFKNNYISIFVINSTVTLESFDLIFINGMLTKIQKTIIVFSELISP